MSAAELQSRIDPRERLRQLLTELGYADISRARLLELALENGRLIDELLGAEPVVAHDLDLIVEHVCDFFGLKPKQILGRERTERVCEARMIVVRIALKHESNTLMSVGKALDGRDHSTIFQLRERCHEAYERSPSFASRVDVIERSIAMAMQREEGGQAQ